MFTRTELEAKKASEIRELARESGLRGAAMLTLSKSELIEKILGGNVERPEVEVPEIKTEQKVEVKTKKHGRQHEQFETLLKIIELRLNAALVGGAGTGKTQGAENCAKALALPFYSISCSNQTTKSEFFGFIDATGNYKKTLFREAFENGGVFLVDEADAGNANVLTAINAALANTLCAFPDQMVSKHADFVCIIAMNTFGRGADRMFVGRNQLDAATLNRFVTVTWDYDERLEREIAPNAEYCAHVQAVRSSIYQLKERVIASTRNILQGSALLTKGFTVAQVDDMIIFQGIDATLKAKILNNVKK